MPDRVKSKLENERYMKHINHNLLFAVIIQRGSPIF